MLKNKTGHFLVDSLIKSFINCSSFSISNILGKRVEYEKMEEQELSAKRSRTLISEQLDAALATYCKCGDDKTVGKERLIRSTTESKPRRTSVDADDVGATQGDAWLPRGASGLLWLYQTIPAWKLKLRRVQLKPCAWMCLRR